MYLTSHSLTPPPHHLNHSITPAAAPEVLLSGGKYKTSVDVWAVGCVLAELLLRRPLFPGDNYLHQLQLITEILGSPSEVDLHFVRSDAARSFMLRLPRYEAIPLAKLFPHVRGPCLDLLARMLTFDPERRISVDDALGHPFLARVRSARKHINEEMAGVPRPFKLKVPGGSAGLRAMSVDAIKGRFYGELCGMLMTPTPSSAPTGPLFELGALDAAAAAAAASAASATAAGGAAAGSLAGGVGGMAETPAGAPASAAAAAAGAAAGGAAVGSTLPLAGEDDLPPAEWRGSGAAAGRVAAGSGSGAAASGSAAGGAGGAAGLDEDDPEDFDDEYCEDDEEGGAGAGARPVSGTHRRPSGVSSAAAAAVGVGGMDTDEHLAASAAGMSISGSGSNAMTPARAAALRGVSAAASTGGSPAPGARRASSGGGR